MKQVNNTFSPRRLWMVMKRDITADGMLYLGIFLGMVALMTYLQVDFFDIDTTDQRVSTFEYYIVNGYIDKAISQVSFGIWQISFSVLVLYLFLMTATLCNPLTKKKSAINYLMLHRLKTAMTFDFSNIFLNSFLSMILPLLSFSSMVRFTLHASSRLKITGFT